MKTIGIITARGGSKGIPEKNKRMFAGKPLVEWTIEAALRAHMLDEIIMSTDDWDIAGIAKRCGIRVPFIRPQEFSADDTPHINVLLHALCEVGKDQYTHCCLLQPTSPLRTSDDIDGACIIAAQVPRDSVVSATKNYEYPFIVRQKLWGYHLENLPRSYLKRQNIVPRYFINGAIYVNPVKMLFDKKEIYAGKIYPYEMPKERSLQIDDEIDFELAEYLMFCRIEDEIS